MKMFSPYPVRKLGNDQQSVAHGTIVPLLGSICFDKFEEVMGRGKSLTLCSGKRSYVSTEGCRGLI